jgi:superfamily II DNA or RNA helicase
MSKGIIRSATASGKSLAISYIIKNLLDNRHITNVGRGLIVVPSTQLVEQFRNDMIEYGLNEKFIGRVYTGYKEWEKAIVISTWQTLQNNHDKIALYDAMIGDECHQNKAHELKKIFSKSRAKYRIGFTGTLPNHQTELYNVKAFLGPVLKEYPSGLLAEQGYISKCNVKAIHVKHPNIESNNYHGIKSEVFNDRSRLNIIIDLVKKADQNILLLVNYLNEGDKLVKAINRNTDKEVVFLSGKDKTTIREEWRQKMMNQKNIALIATYGIFQQGINIPNLKYLVMASPTKSKIRTLQSVGRTLRLHDNKKEGSIIYDIIDEVKFLMKHGEKRLQYYESEGFEIEIIEDGFLKTKDFLV